MPDQAARHGITRIVLPISVGYDLKRFKEAISVVAAHNGCPRCASGRPGCVFSFSERALIMDDKLAITEADPQLPSAHGNRPGIVVGLPQSVSNNLALISQVVDQVVGRLGCLACTSGFDLTFQTEFGASTFVATPEGTLTDGL